MSRNEIRMKLCCDVYARIREQRNNDNDASKYANEAVKSFDNTFPDDCAKISEVTFRVDAPGVHDQCDPNRKLREFKIWLWKYGMTQITDLDHKIDELLSQP